MEIIFSSETSVPIGTRLYWTEVYAVLLKKVFIPF
jgi:hypothetical protein